MVIKFKNIGVTFSYNNMRTKKYLFIKYTWKGYHDHETVTLYCQIIGVNRLLTPSESNQCHSSCLHSSSAHSRSFYTV